MPQSQKNIQGTKKRVSAVGRKKRKGKLARMKALTPQQIQAIRKAVAASARKRKGKRNFRKAK